jgi:hypothetical protein
VVDDGHDDVPEDQEATTEELEYRRLLELHLQETAVPCFELEGFVDDQESVFKAEARAIYDNFI